MKDLLIVFGPKVSLPHLQKKLQRINLNFETKGISTGLSIKNFYKGILVSSFQSLVPKFEQEFLDKNNIVDEIILINPDFDEFDDLIFDFQKRFKGMKFTIYDERIFAPHGGEIYEQNIIDYLLASEKNLISRLKLGKLLHRRFFLIRWWKKIRINLLYKFRPKLKIGSGKLNKKVA